MDDVPAGPASPGPRRPLLSVVIPVHNGGRDFEHCLRRLRDSHWTDFELIVVDDGSTDDSAAIARAAGAIVVRIEAPRGPAAARNLGAARGSAQSRGLRYARGSRPKAAASAAPGSPDRRGHRP